MAKSFTIGEKTAAALKRVLQENLPTGMVDISRAQPLTVGSKTSPDTVSSAAEGSEAAESTTWTRDTTRTPVDVWIQTRTAFYHAGDEKLYGYFRKFSYDSLGHLYAISAETRVEIDVPEDC